MDRHHAYIQRLPLLLRTTPDTEIDRCHTGKPAQYGPQIGSSNSPGQGPLVRHEASQEKRRHRHAIEMPGDLQKQAIRHAHDHLVTDNGTDLIGHT